jgi:hypothetical protein
MVRRKPVSEYTGHKIGNPNLLQQRIDMSYHFYEWRMGIVCILLNRTHAKLAWDVYEKLMKFIMTPLLARMLDTSELTPILLPLGFQGRRALAIIRFSRDWDEGLPFHVCYGVGPYAMESHRIFVKGDIGFEPRDVRLREFVRWVRQEISAGREWRTPYLMESSRRTSSPSKGRWGLRLKD